MIVLNINAKLMKKAEIIKLNNQKLIKITKRGCGQEAVGMEI